jgi:hypothetical protein
MELTCGGPRGGLCDPWSQKRQCPSHRRWRRIGQGPAGRMSRESATRRRREGARGERAPAAAEGGQQSPGRHRKVPRRGGTWWSEQRIERSVGLKFQTMRSPSSEPDICGLRSRATTSLAWFANNTSLRRRGNLFACGPGGGRKGGGGTYQLLHVGVEHD